MSNNLSQWSKDVKKALIDKEMTMKELGAKIGLSAVTVSSIIGGRYSYSSYKGIVKKINNVLGTEGTPKRISTASDEWCEAVKIELVKRKMTVSQLAKITNVSRDRMSLVINGKMMNEEIIRQVNKLLGIKVNATPSGCI